MEVRFLSGDSGDEVIYGEGEIPKEYLNVKDEIKSKIYVTILESWIKKFLCISKNWQELCKRNDDRLYSEKWKEIYKKRSWCVENVFWNIKKNLWFEGFLLRWFEWVQIEWNLICLAHNLKKIMKFQAL